MPMIIKNGVQYLGMDYVGANDAGWNLIGPVGSRIFSKRINFGSAFGVGTISVLTAVISVYMLDSSQGLRLDVKPVSIDVNGFTLQVCTWDNCQIKGLGVQWIAYTP